jgi:hypothetical protein
LPSPRATASRGNQGTALVAPLSGRRLRSRSTHGGEVWLILSFSRGACPRKCESPGLAVTARPGPGSFASVASGSPYPRSRTGAPHPPSPFELRRFEPRDPLGEAERSRSAFPMRCSSSQRLGGRHLRGNWIETQWTTSFPGVPMNDGPNRPARRGRPNPASSRHATLVRVEPRITSTFAHLGVEVNSFLYRVEVRASSAPIDPDAGATGPRMARGFGCRRDARYPGIVG